MWPQKHGTTMTPSSPRWCISDPAHADLLCRLHIPGYTGCVVLHTGDKCEILFLRWSWAESQINTDDTDFLSRPVLMEDTHLSQPAPTKPVAICPSLYIASAISHHQFTQSQRQHTFRAMSVGVQGFVMLIWYFESPVLTLYVIFGWNTIHQITFKSLVHCLWHTSLCVGEKIKKIKIKKIKSNEVIWNGKAES